MGFAVVNTTRLDNEHPGAGQTGKEKALPMCRCMTVWKIQPKIVWNWISSTCLVKDSPQGFPSSAAADMNTSSQAFISEKVKSQHLFPSPQKISSLYLSEWCTKRMLKHVGREQADAFTFRHVRTFWFKSSKSGHVRRDWTCVLDFLRFFVRLYWQRACVPTRWINVCCCPTRRLFLWHHDETNAQINYAVKWLFDFDVDPGISALVWLWSGLYL